MGFTSQALDCLVARTGDRGDGITDLHLLGVLDTTDDIAHITCPQLLPGYHVHLEDTDLVGIILHACIEELHLLTLVDGAIHNLEIGDDATERVEHGVEDQSLQGSFCVTLRMRDALHDGIENLFHALTRLATGTDDVLRGTADEVNNLVLHLVGHGTGHVYLIDNGDNLQVMIDGEIEVGDGLRLYSWVASTTSRAPSQAAMERLTS